MSLSVLQDQLAVRFNNQTLHLAPRLKELFPTHPSLYNCVTKINGSEKMAPVIRRAASIGEYRTHLSPASREGVGALGMYLGERIQHDDKVWWSMSYVVLDFDTNTPAELIPLVTTLLGSDVHTYLTTGTTGRGAHLYIFLKPLMHHKRAYGVVKHLQAVAYDAGLGRPEIRPSSDSGPGSPIFLPYRAAGEDGFGINPLLDPENEMRPASLAEAPEVVKRVAPETLEAVCQELGRKVQKPGRDRRTFTTSAPEGCPLQRGNGTALLEAELERLDDAFVEPHRQNLIMGGTAYALRKLGLDGATVREAFETFIRRNDPAELSRRLAAVERTISKHENGQRVAWREYYERAGLEAPYGVGVPPEVVGQLEQATTFFRSYAWPGRGGASDRSVYAALLKVAAVHGVPHRDGVAVSISVRNLAMAARVGDMTRQKALQRLTEAKLVRRDVSARHRKEDAGVLVLLMEGVHKLSHSISPKGGLEEWDSLYTHPAFMHGKLGKTSGLLLIALLEADTPLTRPELAKLLGKGSRDIRGPLDRLLKYEICCKGELDGTYRAVERWHDALEAAAAETGAHRSLERQQERHDIDREVFATQLTRSREQREF